MLNETELQEIESRLKFAIKNGHIGSVGFVLVEKDIPALVATVRELQRQVQEIERDAKRYRWLRDKRSVAIDTMLHGNGCRAHTAQELGATIDAAMTEDKPHER